LLTRPAEQTRVTGEAIISKWLLNSWFGALLLTSAVAPNTAYSQITSRDDGTQFPHAALTAHNAARAAAGVERLQWDPELGTEAAKYALRLAISDMFAHSNPQDRPDAGENLWMGSRGAFSVDAMIGSWVSERSFFRAGLFPSVSRTGDWRHVGHYTQVVWPSTRRVGCALATNARNDFLVCRYWPAGNLNGVAVHAAPVVSASR
jgi:hypothetical protein